MAFEQGIVGFASHELGIRGDEIRTNCFSCHATYRFFKRPAYVLLKATTLPFARAIL